MYMLQQGNPKLDRYLCLQLMNTLSFMPLKVRCPSIGESYKDKTWIYS